MVKITSDNRRGWARVSARSSIGTMGENMEREGEGDGNGKRQREAERDDERRYLCVCVLIVQCCIVFC